MNDYTNMKKFILAKYEMLGVSQTELAEMIGISRQTLSRWLKTPEVFRAQDLQVLSKVLGLDFTITDGRINCEFNRHSNEK